MDDKAKHQQSKRVFMIDESVEAHGITDTGEIRAQLGDAELRAQLDDSVEGHAVNFRPLDNGGAPGNLRA